VGRATLLQDQSVFSEALRDPILTLLVLLTCYWSVHFLAFMTCTSVHPSQHVQATYAKVRDFVAACFDYWGIWFAFFVHTLPLLLIIRWSYLYNFLKISSSDWLICLLLFFLSFLPVIIFLCTVID
jgi:hypothetical protein